MDAKITLKSLFELQRNQLAGQLAQLKLPEDSQKVQLIVSNSLNSMLENDGEYRQQLTQTEDYILQAALGLLNAQQAISCEISNSNYVDVSTQQTDSNNFTKKQYPYALVGTAVGGAIGALGGTWGTIFGAIAGTALVLYYATIIPNRQLQTVLTDKQIAKPSIRTEVYLDIVKNICESIDNLIETFRTQIKRVENVYEQKEKPSLQKDYSLLLTSIQELVVSMNTECENKEKKLNRLEKKVNDLAENLENYGIAIVDGKIIDLKA